MMSTMKLKLFGIPIDIRIKLAELIFSVAYLLTLLIFCPVGLLSFAETANRAEN